MASKEVFVSADGVRLYSGLDWRLLDPGEKVDAAVRMTAKQLGTAHFALCESSIEDTVQTGKKTVLKRRQSGGFFFSSTDEAPSKKAHSLAAAFAVWASAHNRAVLVEPLSGNAANGFAVIVVIDGLPVQDRVLSTIEEAVDLVTTYAESGDATIFTADTVRFPFAHPITDIFAEIASVCTKDTLIRSVPQNVVLIGIVLVLACAVAGGYYTYDSYKKEQNRKAAAAKAAEDNPVPKYLSALQMQRASLGFERESLVAVFNSASQPGRLALPLQPRGWTLRRVTCGRTADLPEASCYAKFERTFGTFQDITEALPQLKLTSAPTSLELNVANMTWTPVFNPESVAPEVEAIALDGFIRGVTGSQLQTWSLAGIQLKVQAPTLWPTAPGVPANFKHPKALAVGEFSLSDVSLPLVVEAIRSAPANVIWSSWQMDVDVPKKNSDPLKDAKVTLNGIYYVKN